MKSKLVEEHNWFAFKFRVGCQQPQPYFMLKSHNKSWNAKVIIISKLVVVGTCFLFSSYNWVLLWWQRDLLNPPPWMEFGWGKFMMIIIIILKHCFSAFQTPSLWHSWVLISVNTLLSIFFLPKIREISGENMFFKVKVKEIISLFLWQKFAIFSISKNWDYSKIII